MKPKHHAIIYSFLAVAAIGLAVWAAVASADTARLKSAVEQGYEQQLSEAQEHLQAIPIKLDKALVSGDENARAMLMIESSRQADGVVAALSMLPLSHVAISDTLKFCNQLSEWLSGCAARLIGGETLSDDELGLLAQLRTDCTLLQGQIATARQTMTAQGLGLSAQESVYYSDAQAGSRPLEQLADPERGMDYPSMIYDGAFSDARRYGTPKGLSQQQVTAQEAMEIAKEYIGAERVKEIVRSSDTGGTLASYGAVVTLSDGVTLSVEVTRQGGQVLWMMPEHASFEPRLTLEECEKSALAFFNERGYAAMEANHYQLYNGLAVINFVPVMEGVLLYPDLVKLQLRMDTGEVVGVEANNYLMNHAQRENLKPVLSQRQATARVNDGLKVDKVRVCVIPYLGGERLCYEFTAEYEESRFLVYIDAQTGEEVEIFKVIQTDQARMAA